MSQQKKILRHYYLFFDFVVDRRHFAMEKLEQELNEEFQFVSQEMDLISIKCIEVQRRLFEVTLTHHIGEILEPKKEESSKESESKTQKRRQRR